MVKGSDVLLCVVAFFCPPVAALFVSGCCSCDLLINICLTLIGLLPGHIHAFWLVYRKMKAEERYGPGGYIYIGAGTYEPAITSQAQQPPAYGAV